MQLNSFQHTIQNTISLCGKGLHLGKETHLKIFPAPENTGIIFQRTDIDDSVIIPASINYIANCERGTCLRKNGIDIHSIEHLMAALQGLQIDNLRIEMKGEEMPAFDGSSKIYTEALLKAGIIKQQAQKSILKIEERISFSFEESEYTLEPADEYTLKAVIAYSNSNIQRQEAEFKDSNKFLSDIAQCRTFVFLSELEPLFKKNLIKGGDLDNAIVFIDKVLEQKQLDQLAKLMGKAKVDVKLEGILNNLDLYFENEPARHKLLDLMGDLGLLGQMMQAKITAIKPGHRSNAEFVKMINNKLKRRL